MARSYFIEINSNILYFLMCNFPVIAVSSKQESPILFIIIIIIISFYRPILNLRNSTVFPQV